MRAADNAKVHQRHPPRTQCMAAGGFLFSASKPEKEDGEQNKCAVCCRHGLKICGVLIPTPENM